MKKLQFKDLQVGQKVRNVRGYEGVIQDIKDEYEISVLVTKVTDVHLNRVVGEVGNSFFCNIVEIIEDVKEERSDSYEVEVEMNGMIIRMDYKHFEQYMAFMVKLTN